MANDITIEEVKEKVLKGLEVARYNVLDHHPFMGEMLLRFNIVPTYDIFNPTASTDGKKIYFDCEFYSTLTPGQRMFVIAHEVWHNVFQHFMRRNSRDPRLWNEATDMEINYLLKNEGVPGMEILPDCCMPPKPVEGMCAEDIYAYLLKEEEKKQKKQKQGGKSNSNESGNSQGSNGQSDGSEGGDNSNDDNNDDQSPSSSSSSSNGGKNGKKNSKSNKGDSNEKSSKDDSNGEEEQDDGSIYGNSGKKSKYGNQFDKHLSEGDKPQDKDAKPQNGKWGPKGHDKNFKSELSNSGSGREMAQEMNEMVCAVAQKIERQQGSLPSNLKKLVEKVLAPEINWKERLSQFVTRTIGGESATWNRVSRHALANGIYMPGHQEDKIRVAVAIDTSGSCWNDQTKFLSELKGLLNSFGKYEITVIQCDGEVQDVKHYNENDNWNALEQTVAGGGGTSFCPPFKWVRENATEEYNCFIYFTDGYGDAPRTCPPYPVLWVLTKDGYEDFCNWGEKLKFKDNNNN